MFWMLLTGCWQSFSDLPTLDFSEVPYSNPLMASDSAVISVFDTELNCPDGQGTRFAAVYPEDLQGQAPVAIVMHSGVFDYLLEGTLDGDHYQTPSRLERGWAVSKIWETFGLSLSPVDASEVNLGALPAALADAGFVQLYPGNCWGDLWHNEEGIQDNDYSLESALARNGRTIASWMVQSIVDPAFAEARGFSIPVSVDPNSIYLIGLGEGGRGVVELLMRDNTPPISGILIDSSPDDLTPFVSDPSTFAAQEIGIERIFGTDNLDNISDWSLLALAGQGALPDRVGFIYSDADPRVPVASTTSTAEVIANLPGAWVDNRGESAHVFLNRDIELAQAAVEYLLTGVVPPEGVGGSTGGLDTGTDTGN
ncbi:MAG: hypothetical protein ACI8RZ_003278 [Myxococcota bacterium]